MAQAPLPVTETPGMPAAGRVATLLLRWLTYWHGVGDVHQYRYYRCQGCRRIVTHKAIAQGGCICGLSTRLSPYHPPQMRWWTVLRLLVFPWSVLR